MTITVSYMNILWGYGYLSNRESLEYFLILWSVVILISLIVYNHLKK